MRARGWAAVVVLAAALRVAGCGGGEGDDEGPESRAISFELVDRLPVTDLVHGFTYVDLDRGRAALDLEPGAELEANFEAEPEAIGFSNAVAALFGPWFTRPRLTLHDVIDVARISEGANNGPLVADEAVTLIETEQPLEEIAEELEPDGWARHGDLLVNDDPGEDPISPSAIAGADGLLALGHDPQRVRDVLDRDAEPSRRPERELLADLSGPVAAATLGPSGSCIEAVGVSDRLAGGEAEWVLRVSDADPERFRLDDTDVAFGEWEFGEITADGDVLRAPITYGSGVGAEPLAYLYGSVPADDMYECPA